MYQIHSRKVNEVYLLIVVNCFNFKTLIFRKEKWYFCMLDIITPFYISLHS